MVFVGLRRLLVVLGGLALGLSAARADSPTDLPPFDPKQSSPAEREQRLKAVHGGLTPQQVALLLGPPAHVCRQILYHRYLEQWVYDSTFSVRLLFDCPRGQEPRLQSVQSPAARGG